MDKKPVIAIDGPSAAGKSTIGKLLAQKLGYIYIDTGAMYRAIGLKILDKKIPLSDVDAIEKLLRESTIKFIRKDGNLRIILDDRDVSDDIRTPAISQMASDCSALPVVRQYLVKMQQEMGKSGGVVMDGRDIGTAVFPDADYKFFLDASLDVRAERRHIELREKGLDVSYEQVKEEMRQRDHNDSTRKHSPLCRAKDAILIDSTDLGIENVVLNILKKIKQKSG